MVNLFNLTSESGIVVQAFLQAWKQTCSSESEAVLIIPKNKIYHLKPVTFSGPCKSGVTMKVSLRMHGT